MRGNAHRLFFFTHAFAPCARNTHLAAKPDSKEAAVQDGTLEVLRATEVVIANHFALEGETGDEWDDERIFRAALIERIVQLLEYQLERLMHILYRIDVDEAAVNRCFRNLPPGEVAAALADLIIARQKEKVLTRRGMKGKGPGTEQAD